jgi:beta-carotene ketolase (CrtW type)
MMTPPAKSGIESATLERASEKPTKGWRRESVIGLSLALLLAAVWLYIHVTAIFNLPPARAWLMAPILIAIQCWLYVGLFIIAHDCMHGSLAPFRPAVNRAVGTAALFLYAGFSFDKLNKKHHEHHRHSGTNGDPDFDDRHPHGFWGWYWKFLSEYLSWRQPLLFGTAILCYAAFLDAPVLNIVLFWIVPALLSSLQLFTFGTYLPHRPDGTPFIDRHNARTSSHSPLLSLFTCFHFGYHHEHHLFPGAPWWRLPALRLKLSHRSH